jgi:hypothetical protein
LWTDLDAGALYRFDTPEFAKLLELVDPSFYKPRFASIPTLAVVSSNDEFMQLDWTQTGWLDFPGETKLLIVPDSEHSLATGVPELVGTLSAFVGSIAAGHTSADRPSFTYTHNATDGALTVRLTGGPKPEKVVLRHARTLSKTRRDFRWVRLANASGPSACKLPDIPLKKEVEGGGNCLQPILWGKTHLHARSDGSYKGTPPDPPSGHWMGYYIELIYPSELPGLAPGKLQISTPGYVWPDTLPYADCKLVKGAPNVCTGALV